VTIVEFSDFQCPFCKRLAGTLHQLQAEYPKDVRLAYVQFPMNQDCSKADLKKTLHPEACHAAAASVCAGKQGKFWEMHDALFDAQASLGADEYRSLADTLGLDAAAFASCLDAPGTQAAVVADTEAGAALGATGTPTFFVNGRELAGAQPIEVLRAVVDAELAGNKAALDLDVAVGTETTGPVPDGPAAVAVPGEPRVTIDRFEASMEGKAAVSRADVEPARAVSWEEASAACTAAGKRLCTEKEWLAECIGEAPTDADHNGVYSDDDQSGRKYGYAGDRLSGACADSRNPDAVGELHTGNHPKCGTPEGVYDLVGGVKEWVGLTPATAATKGGSYSSGESARCGYFRDDVAADTHDAATGFRCCAGPADPPAPAVHPGRDVGEKLDALTLATVEGGTFKSRSLAGHPAIVTFWASWCGPCQKEMPALAALYSKYKDQGLEVVGISVDTDDAKLHTWLGAHAMPFTIARDPGGTLMATFPNRGLPTTLWIRKDGTIRLRTTGVPPGGEKRLGELVDELLAG
jgi:thiol-disulfide isomerase/thioredoxin